MLTLTLLYADNKMIDRNSGKDFSQGQWQLLSIARAAEHRTVISVSHRTSAELGRTSGKYSIGGSYNLVQGNSRL